MTLRTAVLITDAMAATGMPDGRDRLGSLEGEVKDGKCLVGGRLVRGRLRDGRDASGNWGNTPWTTAWLAEKRKSAGRPVEGAALWGEEPAWDALRVPIDAKWAL